MHQSEQTMKFICGFDDLGDFPDLARRTHKAVKGSELNFVHGAAHLGNLKQPEAFNLLLRAFLAQ